MADPSDDDLWKSLGAVRQPPPTRGQPAPAAAPQPSPPPAAADPDAVFSTLGAKGPTAATAQPGQIDPLTGQKFQFASPADEKSPVVQSMGKPISENVPGPVTQAAGSLPTDPAAQRRVLARMLFPNLPPLEAQSHIFEAPGGRLAAVDNQGNPFYVTPDPSNLSPTNLLAFVASRVGPTLPAAGGLLGGMAGTPGSVAGSSVLAGAGAALGDQLRQFGARLLDPTPPPVDPIQTAKEAVLGAGGQAVGSTINRLAAPNALAVSAPDMRLIRVPGGLTEARTAFANAGSQGVNLTPGQATGLGSLLAYEDAARSMPQSRDIADAFYRRQGEQLQTAAQNFLSQISPVANKTEGAQLFQQGADDAITQARTGANAAARPFYDAAQRGGQVMSPDLAQLADQPAVQDAMRAARVDYQNFNRTAAPDTPDFTLWDLTKRKLDDAYNVANRAGERTQATAIDSLRRDLLTNLDAAYPDYATARATAAPGQRLAARLEESGTGTVADKTGAERAKAIVAPAFNQNPAAVAEARDAYAAAGRQDEWNAGVRAHLQDAFERASMSQQGLNPSTLRRQVWANVDNRDAMQAAMTPQQFQGFDNFMRTIEDTARTFPINSLTTPRAEALSSLRGAAAESGDVRAARTITNMFSLPRLADLPGRLGERYAQWRVGQNVNRIIGRLFSPDGLQYLEAMSGLSPGSQKAIAAVSQIITRYGPSLDGGDTSQTPPPPPPVNLLQQSALPAPTYGP